MNNGEFFKIDNLKLVVMQGSSITMNCKSSLSILKIDVLSRITLFWRNSFSLSFDK